MNIHTMPSKPNRSMRRRSLRPVESLEPRLLLAQFTVTNVNDAGPGSLRQALEDANANAGLDEIRFDIATGPQTIRPTTPLPFITDSLTLDAQTQPGFAGTPLITLDGVNAGTSFPAFMVSSASTTIRGLVIIRFDGGGIFLTDGGGNILEGNYIGTDPAGNAGLGNGGHGVVVSSSNNRIGGALGTTGNVISGNTGDAILLANQEATGNQILGNLLGTDPTGTRALPNTGSGIGIYDTPNTTIGGTSPDARNIIAANNTGIFIAGPNATGNLVLNNYIGTNRNGTAALGNSTAGISIFNATQNTIGGSDGGGNLISGNTGDGIGITFGGEGAGDLAGGNEILDNLIGTNASATQALPNQGRGIAILDARNTTIANNTIAYNQDHGITILTAGLGQPTGNRITANRIYLNAGLGIDLGDNMLPTNGDVTPNDTDDADAGANNLQNFPVLTSVSTDGEVPTISGFLRSTPNTTFTLEFFSSAAADSSGYGEGQSLATSLTLTTDSAGYAQFSTSADLDYFTDGAAITATATDPDGNTSEFSNAIIVGQATLAGSARDLQTVANTPFTRIRIASFTTSNPAALPADFTATIDWGDGTSPTSGTIRKDTDGQFRILASHTYQQAGTHPITITLRHASGQSIILSGQAVVTAPTFQALGVNVAAIEGLRTRRVRVAVIDDGDTRTRPSDYSALIQWGDGQTSSGFIANDRKGRLTVYGVNTYALAGSYPLQVTITRRDDQSATARSNASIANAPLIGLTESLPLGPRKIERQAIFTFLDCNPLARASDYQAIIDWGDNTSPASASIQNLGRNRFSVVADHAYTRAGRYQITLRIRDSTGESRVFQVQAQVR